MPFPLLRIPVVALRYVTNHMSKAELVKISLCSRKADRALKRCMQTELSYFDLQRSSINRLEHLKLSFLEAERAEGGLCTSHRVNLRVSLRDSIEITVTYGGPYIYSFKIEGLNKLEQFSGVQKGLMMNGTFIPVVLTEKGQMHTFLNNKNDGLTFFLNCFKEKFKYVTHSLDVYENAMPDGLGCLRKFINHSTSAEVLFSSVFISSVAQMSIENFKYILENVKFADQSVGGSQFDSHFKANENFIFNSTIHCDEVSIYSGYWITLQYLLACKHKKIMVAGSKFTNEDIKTYMNQWVVETIPDVQKVYAQMIENFQLKHVLSGLQRCKMSENVQLDKRFDRLCVVVKGAGDKVAMIRKDTEKSFQMEVFVDPDAVDIEEVDNQYYENYYFNEDDGEDEDGEGSDENEEDEDLDEDMEENEEENEADDEDEEEESGGDEDMEEYDIYREIDEA